MTVEILDLGVIDSLRRLGGPTEGTRLVRELVERFLSFGPECAERIRRAVAEGGAEQVEFEAHRLKSSAAALGAGRLSERCGALEASARAGHAAEWESLLAGVSAEMAPALDALRGQLQL